MAKSNEDDLGGWVLLAIFWLAALPVITAPYWIWKRLWPYLQEKIGRWAWAIVFAPHCVFVALALVVRHLPRSTTETIGKAISEFKTPAHLDGFLPNLVVGFVVSCLFGAPLFVLVTILKGNKRPSDSHGSSRWAAFADLQAGFWPKNRNDGLMLGWLQRGVPKSLDARYRVTSHVLTCAPTGSGKGIGCVIPNLLNYPGSVVCLDIKGEAWAITRRRRQTCGQDCIAIDPFNLTGKHNSSFNPLAVINPDDEECVSEAASLVDSLIVRTGETDPHWNDSAASLLQGLVLYVATLPTERRHLGTVREFLMLPEAKLLAFMKALAENHACFGLIARSANAFLGKEDRERSGVLSTAQRHTAWLDDPRVVRTLRSKDAVDFSELKRRQMTVYIIVPPDKIEAYRGWIRAVLGGAMKAMIRGRQQPSVPVLFLIDEMAQLGFFKPLEDGISLLRGYGVALWLLVQDLSQLQAVYPRWRSFLANTTLQAFGTQDVDTARYISAMLGQTTIEVESQGNSKSYGEIYGTNSTNRSETGRALLLPDEVRRLNREQVLVFSQGLLPACLRRLNYLTDPQFAGQFDPNPMHVR